MQKVVLLTGSSRGIGKKTALTLVDQGYKVYATMRKPDSCDWFQALSEEAKERVVLLSLDVTSKDEIDKTVDQIVQREGRIDVLINNAGVGLITPIEMVTDEELKWQFDVNFFGPLHLIQSVLPVMRKARDGHIINVSSIAGIVSNPGAGIYCATKHALEAISASLASTVFQWNIKVTVIEPGPISTEFAEVMPLGTRADPSCPYGDFPSKYHDRMVDILKKGQPPEEVASLILHVIESESPNFRYQTKGYKELAAKFIVDPTGNEWLDAQKGLFKGWLSG